MLVFVSVHECLPLRIFKSLFRTICIQNETRLKRGNCAFIYRKVNLFLVYLFSILQEQLIRKLAVILDVQDEDIIVEHLKEAGVGHR